MIKKAYWCPTEKQAKMLLKLLKEEGWRWANGESLDNLYWNEYRGETCYNLRYFPGVTYSGKGFYEWEGYRIIEFNPYSIAFLLNERESK